MIGNFTERRENPGPGRSQTHFGKFKNEIKVKKYTQIIIYSSFHGLVIRFIQGWCYLNSIGLFDLYMI